MPKIVSISTKHGDQLYPRPAAMMLDELGISQRQQIRSTNYRQATRPRRPVADPVPQPRPSRFTRLHEAVLFVATALAVTALVLAL